MNFVFFWTDGFDFKKYFILLLHILYTKLSFVFTVTLFNSIFSKKILRIFFNFVGGKYL